MRRTIQMMRIRLQHHHQQHTTARRNSSIENQLILFIKVIYIIHRNMYRRSIVLAIAKQTERTIVRDPRDKVKILPVTSTTNTHAPVQHTSSTNTVTTTQQQHPPPLPFEPSQQNQQSIGSMVGSYALAGFGMGLGVIFVRMIFGV